MNAVGVYVHTAQLLLRLDTNNSIEQFSDLNRLLGHLRQLLACAVCSRLLNDPFAPRDRNCNHNVCRVCVRGRKCLRPPCIDCKDCQDFKTYVENPQMRCLLLCFKSLCEHIMGAQSLFQQLCRQKQTLPAVVSSQPSTVPVSQMSTQEYIVEGANYTDITSAFTTDLPRTTPINIVPRLHSLHIPPVPPLATSAASPSMPFSALHLLSQAQTISKAETPPSNTLSNTIPTTIVIKQERNPIKTNPTPPPPPLSAMNSHTSISSGFQQNNSTTTALNTQPMAVKNFVKHVQNMNATTTSLSSTSLSNVPASNFTGSSTPSVVVPIVSSSTTTHAPLSIASSRLQSLNRQLTQVRRPITSNNDTVPPLAFKVSLAQTPTTATQTPAITSVITTNSTTATVTSQQVRNPPPIKTVSNGSAMYSVLYTGIGNKITIKRKTDTDEDASSAKKTTVSTSTNTTNTPVSSTVFRQVTISKTINQNKRRGCRCGNATPTPGKLTCCGQRCPCYVESKSCIGCKCRGCRNPHRPDGGKVRPVIPELACYEIQMADETSSLSPSEPPIATVTASLPIIKNVNAVKQQQSHPQQHVQTITQIEEYKPTLSTLVPHIQSTTSSNNNSITSAMTPTATLIPFKAIQATNQTQNLQAQPLQRINTLSGSLTNTVNQLQQTQLVSSAISTSNISTTTTSTTNVLQLENLQRESVLIQNADGQYQVVNLFTTGNSSTIHNVSNSGHVTPLQRIHTISSANSITSTATNSTSGGLQIKQNNLITMHPLTTNFRQNQNQLHQQQHQQHHNNISNVTTAQTPLISPSAPSSATTTITLSPIIVTSPNTLTTSDMFSSSDGSGDEFVTINNLASAAAMATATAASTSPNISNGSNGSTTQFITMPTTANDSTQFSTISIDGIDGNSNTLIPSSAAGVQLTSTTAHLTPALVEVIDSNELHTFQANGFAYN